MDLRSLAIFVEVVANGGFNRAASKLNIAQSALSRRLANLEHELGVQLLVRSKRGVHLTPAGTVLLDRSQSLLRHFDQVQAEMLAEATEPRGELALGLPPSLQSYTSLLLGAVHSRYPKLFIRSWVATSIDLRTMLLSGKLDLMIYASIDAESLLATQPLFAEALHLIGPGGAVTGFEPSGENIEMVPIILTSRPNSVRVLIDAWAMSLQKSLNVVMETNDVSLTLRLVEDGVAFAILPESALSINRGCKSYGPIHELVLSWNVAHSKERPLSMGSRCLIEAVKEFVTPARCLNLGG